MPVHESIDDDDDDDSADNDAHPAPGAPRQSYNFAPGYHGVVYRADVPDWGAGPRREGAGDVESHDDSPNGDGREQQENDDNNNSHTATATAGHDEVRYKLQSMKWGLVPSWTSRNPDYKTVLKTINCRDDSLSRGGGMWASMKARKRCVVVAQGFYEWLKKDGARDRDKIPHYVRRRDGRLLCMAGLWDVVQYEGEDVKHYTYTIITTDSNRQLGFLHDRMPAVLENGSDEVRKWLDPARHEWSGELQSLLRPWEGSKGGGGSGKEEKEGGLEIYPVSKDVGKVGNNSPTFIVPVDSKENKNNIANFFTSKPAGPGSGGVGVAGGGKGTAQKKDKEEKQEAGESAVVKTETLSSSSQPDIVMTRDKGIIADDQDDKSDNSTQQHVKSKDATSQSPANTLLRKRPAPHSSGGDNADADADTDTDAEPPLKKKKEEKFDQALPATSTTTTATVGSTTAKSADTEKPAARPMPSQIKSAIGKGDLVRRGGGGRPKISATSNGTKSPVKGKDSGTQKITKFFGNSA